ncbi:expressed unknown protein [Seminavis robusta]|uniref:Uncharacterized protein n=1 Tax=Seminavis robusta TaxID=568900 RepID=A0A9N8DVU9_9STRA|nr:expressed unknown protein [Seminavis robusta]|eukprot:Sro390_g132900.1 n/a (402) ;mRNA; f:49597-51282
MILRLSLLVVFFLLAKAEAQLRAPTHGVDDNTTLSDGPQTERRLMKHIELLGNNGRPPKGSLPLQECQGDCDNDDECGDGMVCFHKPPFTAVPNCIGGDYDKSKSGIRPRRPPQTARPTPAPAPQPTKYTTPTPPSGNPRIKLVGNRRWAPGSLGLCEGDCDKDRDCEGDFVCQQRGRGDPVRGCDGYDGSKTDYCVLPRGGIMPTTPTNPGTPTKSPTSRPTDRPTTDSPTSQSPKFRLKLYWEDGYYWQEETRERKWCAVFDYKGLPGDGRCWYGRQRRACRPDQVYVTKCKDEYRQYFRFVKLGSNLVQIKLGDGRNLCFQRVSTQIFLRTCDEKNKYQQWYAPNGSFDGSKFELSQHSNPRQCMTQAHHPKAGEVVETHSCKAARSDEHETSFWNKY